MKLSQVKQTTRKVKSFQLEYMNFINLIWRHNNLHFQNEHEQMIQDYNKME